MDDEQLTIQLSGDCIALLASDRNAFAAALRNELMEHVDEIECFLPRYCTDTREDFTEECRAPELMSQNLIKTG